MSLTVQQFYQLLAKTGDAPVRFQLPAGELIPEHFHITEVGRIDKSFIDCGGTRRQAASCLLQAWVAEDLDHRLVAGKLAGILKLAEPMLGDFNLPVEVEYGADVAAQYTVTDFDLLGEGITFQLSGKKTDCLARDKCGVGGCDTNSGCC